MLEKELMDLIQTGFQGWLVAKDKIITVVHKSEGYTFPENMNFKYMDIFTVLF